jgi:hypothetical protein
MTLPTTSIALSSFSCAPDSCVVRAMLVRKVPEGKRDRLECAASSR